MSRIVAIGTKIEQVAAMLGTTDLTDWEQGFVTTISEKFSVSKSCAGLTDRQIEIVERIWGKHFA